MPLAVAASPHRRRVAAGDLAHIPKKGGVDKLLVFLALCAACLLAFVSFNHGRGYTVQSTSLQYQLEAAREASEDRYSRQQQSRAVIPGKRHRKLKHGLSIEEQQQSLDLESEEQEEEEEEGDPGEGEGDRANGAAAEGGAEDGGGSGGEAVEVASEALGIATALRDRDGGMAVEGEAAAAIEGEPAEAEAAGGEGDGLEAADEAEASAAAAEAAVAGVEAAEGVGAHEAEGSGDGGGGEEVVQDIGSGGAQTALLSPTSGAEASLSLQVISSSEASSSSGETLVAAARGAVQEAVGTGYNEEAEELELEQEMQRQEAASALEEAQAAEAASEQEAAAAAAAASAAAAGVAGDGDVALALADVEAASGGGGSGGQGFEVEGKQKARSPYYKALEHCKTLQCVREAAKQKRFRGQFLFPHFFIIGWQKSATTSLFKHLILHPSIRCPLEKEPEFFSYECSYDPEGCPPDKQREYIEETLHLNSMLFGDLRLATFEGSTHYAREGQRLAKGIARTFPWAKLIASMREPISRAISMLAHNLDRRSIGCLTKRHVFDCLQRDLPGLNYSEPFQAWLDAFPRDQIMLVQYESLTAPEHVATHLKAVKSFLEIYPELPANELVKSNTREERLGKKPEGWPMKRHEYEQLIAMVRPDAERIAEVVTSYGFGDGALWMHNWERAWQLNLGTCDASGDCIIQLT